ncbi:MAG TPA: YgiQ family radical SAM protein, partial [Cellvibrio sp.]
NSASALIPDEQTEARNKPRSGHNPNPRAQQQKPRAGSPAKPQGKPAAKAFGDKFESAKKFNQQQTTPAKPTAKPVNGRNTPNVAAKTKPASNALSKNSRPGKPNKPR